MLDRDELGLALARALAISDRLLEESAAWIWIGGTIPDTSGRTSRGERLIARYADRMPELLGAGGPMSRLAILLALVAAVAASLAPAAAPTARAAAPDLTLDSDATYDVDPLNQRIHVTSALTAINHLKDTKTRLYYFDGRSSPSSPDTTNFKIAARIGSPRVRGRRPPRPTTRSSGSTSASASRRAPRGR